MVKSVSVIPEDVLSTRLPGNIEEFLNKTIPYFASEPVWRELFDTLAGLNEETRKTLLIRMGDPVPKELAIGLEPEQLETLVAFLRDSLEDLNNPKMMVKCIDFHSNSILRGGSS